VRPGRILLVRLSHLGDVVHALPIFHGLRAVYPEARLAWAVQPEFAELLDGLEGLERTVTFERTGGVRAWPRLWRDLAQLDPDWAIDAQGNLKSALVTLCSGAARRSGLHRSDWTEAFGAHVLTDAAPALEGARAGHALERSLHLARHVAPGFDGALPADWLMTRPEEREHARQRLARLAPAGRAPLRVLHLAAPGDVRSWPAQRFAELARGLARRGQRVLVISGPAEEQLGRELALELADLTAVGHWIGQRGLRELAAAFAVAAGEGARLVTCDSGPLHLAAACGLAVTALSGPQDARRTGPWPPPGEAGPHRVIVARDRPPCAPCRSRRCTHEDGAVCMSRIEAEQVIESLLAGAQEPAVPCG